MTSVTVTLDMGRLTDGCDAATFLGHVRVALEASPQMVAFHGGELLGLVAEVPGDEDSIYRHAIRVPTR